ncbi:MAG: hypothetical protein LCH52_08565 [Bacteroidetes bacterium]|nr:hypothetical protein [Bacteroidota bacterium]
MKINKFNKGFKILLYIDKVINLEARFQEVNNIIQRFNPSGKAILWKYETPIGDEDPVMTSDFYSRDKSFQIRIKITHAYVGLGIAFHKEISEVSSIKLCEQYYILIKEIAESLSYICFVKYLGEIEYRIPRENELKEFLLNECPGILNDPRFISFAFNYKFLFLDSYYLQVHNDLRVIIVEDKLKELKSENVFVVLIELSSIPLFEKKVIHNDNKLNSIWDLFFETIEKNNLVNYLNAEIQ